ncbi:hypothetical protein [Antarcticirhabdus aurantiaca]|uniref:Uncharacterized protein n=1 Tax=Antarcticirhabdus aurantiaca TaxID=2606717 RepID=A0ACD4NJN7_9HYPH|nr:hypothetical protein [Antarcticirhabdus aurantiaca]WAJ26985.1 hypothetical protein OXU80_19250 [Jeongeuplla avenae]
MPPRSSVLQRLAAALLVGGLVSSAESAGARDAAAGRIDCFARSYDAAHHAAHPAQAVETIWLGHTPEAEADRPTGRVDAVLGFGFRLGGEAYSGLAYCRSLRCEVEGDAGSFTLLRKGRSMRLTVGPHLSLEGADGFSPDLARSADDRVFLLHPAPAGTCR